MRRRQFAALGAAGATSLALPRRSAGEQPGKSPRIGWLWNGRSAGNPQEVTGFREGLKEFGYVDGQNIIVDYRFTEGRPDRIPELAAELMRLRPDVLVAFGTTVIGTIKNATGDLPLVSLSGDPVGAGFVASLARPGGQITGISMMQGQEGLTGKRIDQLKDALPAATRIGMMFNPDYSAAAPSIEQAQQVARRRDLVLILSPVRRMNEIDTAINVLAEERVHAVNVEPADPFVSYQPEMARQLLQLRIPAVSELRLLVEAGGLLSYGPSIFDASRRLVYFVDRILKGTKPADLPVEQASKLELVLNLRTARLLDITLPQILLAGADEALE
jgi:putative tryptophan/tyrosine transport system substrate-binding protein